MRVTKQKVLRRFWYALMPMSTPGRRPEALPLMGEDIVLWKQPTARRRRWDRCCHRTAKLSKGWCERGNIVCGYHGWTYDCTGHCVRIPQQPTARSRPAPRCRPTAHGEVRLRLGRARGAAAADPALPRGRRCRASAASSSSTRRGRRAPLRMMENSFDNSHFTFVHKANFGHRTSPSRRRTSSARPTTASRPRPCADPQPGSEPQHHRHDRADHRTGTWSTATTCRSRAASAAHYPASGIDHIIYNCATPIDDDRMMLVQWLYRNDSEEDCTTQALIDWDARDHGRGPRHPGSDRLPTRASTRGAGRNSTWKSDRAGPLSCAGC